MNNEEVKQALANGKPVIYFVPLVGDVRYDRVSAVIYRIINGELAVTAELEDRKGRSTATVRIDRLRFENKEDKENDTEFAIQTVFEIAVVVLIVYGFVKEDKLIAFEDRVRAKIRAKRSGHNAATGKDR